MSTMRRAAWPLVAVVVVVGFLFLAVFPTRTYLDQRRTRADLAGRIEVLSAQNDQLERRAKLLHTDAEIERLAREQYNLVRPGEEAYAILPAPDEDAPLPVVRQPGDAIDRAARRLAELF